MKILNDYVGRVRVYFELNNPKPVKARVILEDGDKEELVLYDGLFLKGKNGYAPTFYVKDDVEILVGIGDRMVKIPTGENAFWEIPPEFIALAKRDIVDVNVIVEDKNDVALLSKVYNYLLKVAPEMRSKYEKEFILDKFSSLEEFSELKYVVLNSVAVRTTKVDGESIELIELNDGRTLAQTKDGLYLLFDRRPTATALSVALKLARASTDYAVVRVNTHHGDIPVEVWTALGDVVMLIKRMKGGIVIISKKTGEFIAKISPNAYVSGFVSSPEQIKKLEKSTGFAYTTPVGDVRTLKNKWGEKVTLVFTKKEPTRGLIDNVEEYLESIEYTATWVKGISEGIKKAVTVKLPTAVAGFIGKALRVKPLEDIEEL